jgi:UDP-glucose 4-epimerase
VTGAAGFIGSHLTETCLQRGWRVTAVDSFTDYYPRSIKAENAAAAQGHPNCTWLELDLATAPLEPLLADVDIIFHLAAQAGVRASWGTQFDIYTVNNVTVVQRLLEAARHAALQKFVFASSSSVYGDAATRPTPESAAPSPVSPYGATKVLGEHLASLYWKSYGVPVVSLRYFTVYGPRQRPDMAFHRLIDAALTGGEVAIFGDGRQMRDFTFVSDIVEGTLSAGEHGRSGGVYNLGGGNSIALLDAIAAISDIAGSAPSLRFTERQRGDARDTTADASKAAAELLFSPRQSLQEGLRQQIKWQVQRLAAV